MLEAGGEDEEVKAISVGGESSRSGEFCGEVDEGGDGLCFCNEKIIVDMRTLNVDAQIYIELLLLLASIQRLKYFLFVFESVQLIDLASQWILGAQFASLF